MSCPVLASLSSAVAAVEGLPVLCGLGADVVLDVQVHAVAAAVARLQRELAVRMAALQRAAPGACDVRGDAVRAGLDCRRAGLLRRVGVFAASHHEVEEAWRSGRIRLEQIELLRGGAGKVPGEKRDQMIAEVLHLLPGLDEKDSRRLIEFAVDQLTPGDPDHEELAEHAARRLAWSRIAGGGLAFEGYLPAAEGAAFTAAIDALAQSMRVAADALTPAQRRADGLAALVAAATEHRLPSGGGLPAAMTLTVSLTEAERIARRDPAHFASRITLAPRRPSEVDREPAGDATVRFGMCCAAITPILTDQAETAAAHGSDGRDPGKGEQSHSPDGPTAGHPRRGAGSCGPGTGQPDTPSRRCGRSAESRPVSSPKVGDSSDPVPITTERSKAPGSLLDRVARTPVVPLAVGRSVRLATAAQRHALRVRDGGCVIAGCEIDAAYTQPHHVVGWALGGTTDLDQMVSLCWVHHRLTELGRFKFTPRNDGGPQPPGSFEHPHWWITPPFKATA